MAEIIDFKERQQTAEVIQRLGNVGSIITDIIEALDKGYMHMDNMEMQFQTSQDAFELILAEAMEKLGPENIPTELLEKSRLVSIEITDEGIYYQWQGKKWKRLE